MKKSIPTGEEKLNKKLSPINVWALAFGCIIGWGAFVMPGNTFLPKAGPLGTLLAMSISAVIMIIIAFNYSYMIGKSPTAGGEFSYAEQEFGKINGFICAWFLGLSYLAIVPLNATALALVGKNVMNNVFQKGYLYQVSGYDIYLGEIVLALFALILCAGLAICGVKITGTFQTLLAIVLVGSVGIICIATLFSSKASFDNLAPGFYPADNEFMNVLSVVAIAPWAFVGFDTIPQAAEEFRFSGKKTKGIMALAILFGALTYILLNTISVMVIPRNYNSWVEYIDELGELKGVEAMPTFFVAREVLGNAGLIVIEIAVFAAILSGIMGFYMATSRLLYAMSRKGVLPKFFGKLHKKYKTPIYAIVFIMLISMIAPFGGRTVLTWIVDMSSVGAAIGYGYTSAAAYKIARGEGNKAIMVNGIVGVALSVSFLVLLLVPIKLFSCSLGKESYICLIIWIILGIIFYISTKKKEKSK